MSRWPIAVTVNVVSENGKFIAAEAREEVRRSRCGLEAVGDHAQHAISNSMSVIIVDALEAVEIQKEEGVMAAVLTRPRCGIRQRRQHAEAVGEKRLRGSKRFLRLLRNKGSLGAGERGICQSQTLQAFGISLAIGSGRKDTPSQFGAGSLLV